MAVHQAEIAAAYANHDVIHGEDEQKGFPESCMAASNIRTPATARRRPMLPPMMASTTLSSGR